MPQRPCSAPRVCSNRALFAARMLGGNPRTFAAPCGAAMRSTGEGTHV
jgi:hypothetical protein